MNLIATLAIFIILILIIWWVKEYNKPVFIPLNEEEQKILQLLKDNIEGSEFIANISERFENVSIRTSIKWLTFRYYKSFRYGTENVSIYLTNPHFIQTDEDKIFISSRLEKSILEVLKPYSYRIISEETKRINKKNLERQEMVRDELKKVLEDVEIK